MDVVLPELIERTKDSIRSFELSPSTISQYQTAWKTLAGYFLEYNQALFSRPLAQAGIPLSHLKEFLGHASINTTDIYAAADSSMLRAALEKISTPESRSASAAAPIWQDNEDMILKLCGLK